ncbi:MAG: EutN/CcmL family microcompartment protein [Myxococcota bacterium]|nr:EutN/CcmL family microcompartment protein [Myxococcota bacterium]
MELARVIGTVVASQKYEGLEGVKLLLVEALDEGLQAHGDPFVVCDSGQHAGPGDVVSWIGGREAALALPETFVPVDAAIVGVIDQIDARSIEEVLG